MRSAHVEQDAVAKEVLPVSFHRELNLTLNLCPPSCFLAQVLAKPGGAGSREAEGRGVPTSQVGVGPPPDFVSIPLPSWRPLLVLRSAPRLGLVAAFPHPRPSWVPRVCFYVSKQALRNVSPVSFHDLPKNSDPDEHFVCSGSPTRFS